MELSFLALGHLNGPKKADTIVAEEKELSSKKTSALQYLSGHVVHKVFIKLQKSKHWQQQGFQQCMELLKAFKVDPIETHKLVKARDQGGLWYVCQDGEDIISRRVFRGYQIYPRINPNF